MQSEFDMGWSFTPQLVPNHSLKVRERFLVHICTIPVKHPLLVTHPQIQILCRIEVNTGHPRERERPMFQLEVP